MEIIDILMVEDEKAILELYKALFQFHPYSVKFASTGEEVLDLIKTYKFRVCVLDIHLHSNNVNGVDLCILLKDTGKAEKVFAMTGLSNVFDDFDPSIAGFDQVFYKPDQFKLMLGIIINYLKGTETK